MSAFRRYMLEEQFVQLAADAIERQHPQSDWLVAHGYVGNTGLTERALEAAVERLGTWLADHERTAAGTG